jgi:RNA polymerase sigma-70 factor, ECF subfamily
VIIVAEPQTAQAQPRTPAADEARMVDRAKRGDEDAFAWIYERHWSPIYNFVFRMMGSPHDAEDLATDAFLKAWLSLTDPESRVHRDPSLRLSPWLYRVATNVCLDELRHRKLVKWEPWEAFVSVFHPSQAASAKDQPERLAVAREDAEEVGLLLDQLPHRERAALVLREYHDLSYTQIAAALFITRAAVKSLVYRAREDFYTLYRNAARQPGRGHGGHDGGARQRKGEARGPGPATAADGGEHDGHRLFARRTALGLSQNEVARLIGYQGHGSMSRLEQTGQATEALKARVWRALDDYEASKQEVAA